MATKPTFAEKKEPRAPSMTRSRSQLASAYSPGAIFTFEGGLGACLSIPDQGEYPDLAQISPETRAQVHLRLREVWQTWFSRAMEGGNQKHPALPYQCLDPLLIRDGSFHAPPASQFEMVNPRSMGYAPAPLAFTCNTCGRFRDFESSTEAAGGLGALAKSSCDTNKDDAKGKCRWRQLDVVFVHWSGHWSAPLPGRWEWSLDKHQLQEPIKACSICQSKKFYLRDKSPRIGEWVFECENGHKDGDSWLQNDRETTEILGDDCATRPPRWRRMEPISYRASAAFYPHTEQFIVFAAEQRDLFMLMQEGQQDDLARFISSQYVLGAKVPGIDEILEMLSKAGHKSKVDMYRWLQSKRDEKPDGPMAAEFDTQMVTMMTDWKNTPGLIQVEFETPAWLQAQIARRTEFGSRYDPMVLSVEHEALSRAKLTTTAPVDGRSQFVRFAHPDKDMAPRTDDELKAQTNRTQLLESAMGLEELGLIREFDLCRFTHGYTRMTTDPLIEKKDQQSQWFPVRLRLFPSLGTGKRPLYIVTQANEAIYVRLNPTTVYDWLRAVGVSDLPEWSAAGDLKLGAHVLESAMPFGKFFTDLHKAPPMTYRYVYTLLHTYAHTFMRTITEFSGLDLSSLGEYLFPADLAFVVYRNGTTMDLGNLSALWRNYNTTFLEQILSPRSLMCGSGSLCDSSGGACPDCVMIPETSCVASNQLLSRAVLREGPAPREDNRGEGYRIPGYLDVAQAALAKAPAAAAEATA